MLFAESKTTPAGELNVALEAAPFVKGVEAPEPANVRRVLLGET